MIKSMTGFGRGEYSDENRAIVVEIKSVNHRYCDINVRLSRRYSFAEEKIKGVIKEKIKRGKIDVSLMIENIEGAEGSDVRVILNKGLAREYYDSLITIARELELSEDISPVSIGQMPDVIKTAPDILDEETLLNQISEATVRAVEDLENMRICEGAKLREDAESRGAELKRILEEIKSHAVKVPQLYMEKMKARIRELIDGSVDIPSDRILTEVAIFADKANIDEEITRLSSHISQLYSILAGEGETYGKKLDFLVQEMNREANTIGSKANDLDITNCVLELKSEIEKIREQIQNIE